MMVVMSSKLQYMPVDIEKDRTERKNKKKKNGEIERNKAH